LQGEGLNSRRPTLGQTEKGDPIRAALRPLGWRALAKNRTAWPGRSIMFSRDFACQGSRDYFNRSACLVGNRSPSCSQSYGPQTTVSRTVASKKHRTALEPNLSQELLEVLVNQYDWLRGPLTFRVAKRLKFSAVGIVGITLW